jgi:hypothetical protein
MAMSRVWLMKTCLSAARPLPQVLLEVEALGPGSLADLWWSIASMEVAKAAGDAAQLDFRPPSSWMQLLVQVRQQASSCSCRYLRPHGNGNYNGCSWMQLLVQVRPE